MIVGAELGYVLAFWMAVGGAPEWASTLVEPWHIALEDLGLRGPFPSWEECRKAQRAYDSECFSLARRTIWTEPLIGNLEATDEEP